MEPPSTQGASPPLSLSPQERHWRAEREMADALSAFQAGVQPAPELTMQAVVEAARPAFQLGFCFSVRSTGEGTAVLLMHRSGAQQIAESEADDVDFQLSARLLAGLLGIPVHPLPRPCKPGAEIEPDNAGAAAMATSAAAVRIAPAKGAINSDASGDSDGDSGDSDDQSAAALAVLVDEPLADSDLQPLSADQISTLTAMLKAMARDDKEAWKQFCIAFRGHFQVPRTALTITDRITQRRHASFIDRYEQELSANRLPAAAHSTEQG